MASATSSNRVRPRPSFSDDEDLVVAPPSTGHHAAAPPDEPHHQHGGDDPAGAPASDSRARVGLERQVRRRTEGGEHAAEGGVGGPLPSGSEAAEDAVMEDADSLQRAQAQAVQFFTNDTIADIVRNLSPPVPEPVPLPAQAVDQQPVAGPSNAAVASGSGSHNRQRWGNAPPVGHSPLFDTTSPAQPADEDWRGVHPASLAGTPPGGEEDPPNDGVGGLFTAANSADPRAEATFRINGHDVPLPEGLRSLDPIIFTTTLRREVEEWRRLEAARRDVITGNLMPDGEPRRAPDPTRRPLPMQTLADVAWRRFRDLDRRWDDTRHTRYLNATDCFRVDMAWNTPPGSELNLDQLIRTDASAIEAQRIAHARAAVDDLNEMLRLQPWRHRPLVRTTAGPRMLETASESSTPQGSDAEVEKEPAPAAGAGFAANSMSRWSSTSSDARVMAMLVPPPAGSDAASKRLPTASGFLRPGMVFSGRQATVPMPNSSTRKFWSQWQRVTGITFADMEAISDRTQTTSRGARPGNATASTSARTRPRPSTAMTGPLLDRAVQSDGPNAVQQSARQALDNVIERLTSVARGHRSNNGSGANGRAEPSQGTASAAPRTTTARPQMDWLPREPNIWERIRISLDEEAEGGQHSLPSATWAAAGGPNWASDPPRAADASSSGPSDAERWASLFSRNAQPIGPPPTQALAAARDPGATTAAVRLPRRRRTFDNVVAELTADMTPDRPAAPADGDVTEGSEWEVQVTLTHADLSEGTVRGVMRAYGMREGRKRRRQIRSSMARSHASFDHPPDVMSVGYDIDEIDDDSTVEPVLTGFDGEIIDFKTKMLWAEEEGPTTEELENWRQTPPFKHLDSLEKVKQMLYTEPAKAMAKDYVLMRWKESTFINCEPHESGLSISGHYVVAMHRTTGEIEAFYHDPNSLPSQKLSLSPRGQLGVGFPTMDFA